jgi:UDP-glucuronate 4-epimerase
LYNVGSRRPVEILGVIELLEAELGRKAVTNLVPMQPGDLLETYADVGDLPSVIGFTPETRLAVGIHRFVEWYREFYSPVPTGGVAARASG